MHALLDAVVGALGDAEQLDAIAELVGRLEIGRRDRRNALDIDRVRIDLGAEREAGQDRELVRGVVALDVEGRIGLGIAEPLRVLQAVGERQLLPLHAREDVIAGAVEDAVDAREASCRPALAQRLDDRDAARDRGLEVERDALFFSASFASATPCCASSALLAVTTDLPAASAASTAPLRGIAVAAHQLDEHIDLGIDAQARPDRRPSAISARSTPRFLAFSAPMTATTSIGRPQRAGEQLVARCAISRTTEAPTVPRPASTHFERRRP